MKAAPAAAAAPPVFCALSMPVACTATETPVISFAGVADEVATGGSDSHMMDTLRVQDFFPVSFLKKVRL